MNKVCSFAASRHHVRNREPIKMQSAILKVTFPNHLRDLTEISGEI